MKQIRFILLIFLVVFSCALPVKASEAEIYDRVDADALLRALPEETRSLLQKAEITPNMAETGSVETLLTELSADIREEVTKPAKTLLTLLSVFLFTRILIEFAPNGLNRTAELCGALCAAILLFPTVLELLEQTADTTRVLGGFLAATVPVYTGLLLFSGSTAAGTTYGALTLAAANGITALSGQLFVPLLRVFLALTTVSAAASNGLERFTEKLYKCVKWILTLTVSVFTGILSLQTLLSARADAVTGKAVKMVASSAVPIIGGAFSDALAVLSAGVGTVKSSAGAFGILAALLILLPLGIRICIWIMICEISSFTAEIISLRSVGSFLNGCSTALKMLLALLFSAGMAAVISAAVLLCVRGVYG